MSFLSNLLNPAPSSGPSSPGQTAQSPHHPDSHQQLPPEPVTSIHKEQPRSPTIIPGQSGTDGVHAKNSTRYSNSPPSLRVNSYGGAAQPVEPSPPLERGPISPTLEQYHLPRAQEIQRRQSFATARATPPPVLAPTQSHSPQRAEGLVQISPARQDATGPSVETTEKAALGDEANEETTSKMQPELTSEIHKAAAEAAPVMMDIEPPTIPPEPEVKPEPANSDSSAKIPPALEISQGTPPTSAELPTPRKIADLRQEASSRASSTERSSPVRTTPGPMPAPAAGAPKKRPAPSATGKKAAESKKGTARKPPAKKRKVDADSLDGTPVSTHREASGTPTSSRASKTPAPRGKKQASVSVAGSPPPRGEGEDDNEGDDEDYDDSGEVFCICRKPDNHTWMIGCDGGCEDWFHGKCVSMREEDGDLIDKYICPNCEEAGKGQTTWKPMCRLPGCRKPARLTMKNLSKYCSDDHGRQFLKQGLQLSDNVSQSPKLRRKENRTDHTGNGNEDHAGKKRRKSAVDGDDDYVDDPMDMDDNDAEEDEPIHLRGGRLNSRELKAVASDVSSVEEFRKLGEAFMSPPATVSPEEDITTKTKLAPSLYGSKLKFTPAEEEQMQKLEEKQKDLTRRSALLKDQEKFLNLVRQRGKSVLEKLQKKESKLKDICGYDSRLSWSEAQFEEWRNSPDGKHTLTTGTLQAPSSDELRADARDPNADEEDESTRGVCQKKRCERHKQWIKVHLNGLRFEEARIKQENTKIEAEMNAVKQRAHLRELQE